MAEVVVEVLEAVEVEENERVRFARSDLEQCLLELFEEAPPVPEAG